MKIKIVAVGSFVLILSLFFFRSNVLTLNDVAKEKEEELETRGVFLSYIELKKYLYQKDDKTSKKNIRKIIKTMKDMHFDLLILQVRSFSDAIYPSRIFPSSKVVVTKEGDPLPYDYLDYFLKEAHKENIEVHAWINPYRVSSNANIGELSVKNPASSWIGTSRVEVIPDKGIYYNPASTEVKDLIVKGVEELVESYDIDGIHLDDYFYPSKTVDLVSYEESASTKSLYAYRLDHVNDLVKRIYQTVHKKENIVFGISPQGNIENNYESQFADVRTWASEKGYVDYLMPQVYYGFYNEAKPYYEVVKEWDSIIKNKDVSLYFTLALYKAGSIDQFAKSGANEWIDENDILKKEVLIARNLSHYKGFSLFRYDYLVSPDLQVENTIQEIDHLKEILN